MLGSGVLMVDSAWVLVVDSGVVVVSLGVEVVDSGWVEVVSSGVVVGSGLVVVS